MNCKGQIIIIIYNYFTQGFPGGSNGKESMCIAGDPGLSPGSGRSPGAGHGNPLQYSYLENSMDSRAWRATVYRVAKPRSTWADSQTSTEPQLQFIVS